MYGESGGDTRSKSEQEEQDLVKNKKEFEAASRALVAAEKMAVPQEYVPLRVCALGTDEFRSVLQGEIARNKQDRDCLLYTSPSPRDS